MQIEKIEVISLKHPWGPPENNVMRDWPIVLVHADNGLVGISRGGNANLIKRDFAPVLIGADARRITRLWQQMYEIAWRYRGPGRSAMGTIGAIDIALWDLYGKSLGEPVWRLLGGYRNRVPAYADGIGYFEQSPEEMAVLVKKHADLGYDAVKFHLTTPDPDIALEKVKLAREALGSDKKLMLDAFSMWDGHLAVELARQFNSYNLYWLEEPVRKDDEIGHMRMVREVSNALLAGGESEGTLYGILRLITAGGLQVLQTDILGGGGYTGLMRMAAVAEAHHVYIAPHGAQYPDINCQFLAAVPNGLMIPACPATEPYQLWSKLYKPAFEVENGEVKMTDRPGIGLELNWDFVEKYKV